MLKKIKQKGRHLLVSAFDKSFDDGDQMMPSSTSLMGTRTPSL